MERKNTQMSADSRFSEGVGDAGSRDVTGSVKAAASAAAGFDPIDLAHRVGVRSRHAYIGGFASIVLALVTWSISRAKPSDSKGQSDRWGIFIGHWAPTFFAVGLALKTKEND
jgi:hypothetical protein